MIGIVGALPRELAGLVRTLRPEPELRRRGVYLYRMPRAVVVCAGMGTERATLAVRTALEAGATSLLSVGLAGACDPARPTGSLLEVNTVIDALSGIRYAGLSDATGAGTLVTTHTIASVHEKHRLFASYGAAAVDMEAATVARLAGLNGIAFRALKAISDAHNFELSSLSRFASKQGHFRVGAFALHTALRPAGWRKAVQLGAGSQKALRTLTERLKEIVA